MHYIRIAIAIAVGVSIGNLSIKDKKKLFNKSKEWLNKSKGWLNKFWGICWIVLKWLFLLALVGVCIYTVYRLIKTIDWEGLGEVSLYLLLYCSPAIAFVILIVVGLWLDKKRQKRKNNKKES